MVHHGSKSSRWNDAPIMHHAHRAGLWGQYYSIFFFFPDGTGVDTYSKMTVPGFNGLKLWKSDSGSISHHFHTDMPLGCAGEDYAGIQLFHHQCNVSVQNYWNCGWKQMLWLYISLSKLCHKEMYAVIAKGGQRKYCLVPAFGYAVWMICDADGLYSWWIKLVNIHRRYCDTMISAAQRIVSHKWHMVACILKYATKCSKTACWVFFFFFVHWKHYVNTGSTGTLFSAPH